MTIADWDKEITETPTPALVARLAAFRELERWPLYKREFTHGNKVLLISIWYELRRRGEDVGSTFEGGE